MNGPGCNPKRTIMNAPLPNATMTNAMVTPAPVRTETRVPNAPIKKRPLEQEDAFVPVPPTAHPPPVPKRIHF